MVKTFWNEKWEKFTFEDSENMRNKYAVSNYGRVVSYRDEIKNGKLLKGGKVGGYPTINVKPNGKAFTFYIHRVVADMFVSNPSNHPYVIHLDYKKHNNYFENLRWVSKEVMNAHNDKNPNVIKNRQNLLLPKEYKLNEGKVKIIKKMLKNKKTRIKMIAKQFGVSEMQIYRIKSGENWGHVEI